MSTQLVSHYCSNNNAIKHEYVVGTHNVLAHSGSQQHLIMVLSLRPQTLRQCNHLWTDNTHCLLIDISLSGIRFSGTRLPDCCIKLRPEPFNNALSVWTLPHITAPSACQHTWSLTSQVKTSQYTVVHKYSFLIKRQQKLATHQRLCIRHRVSK